MSTLLTKRLRVEHLTERMRALLTERPGVEGLTKCMRTLSIKMLG
jgi:hypothetical protein